MIIHPDPATANQGSSRGYVSLTRRLARPGSGLLCAVILLIAASSDARAGSTCGVAFPFSATPITLDGQLGSDWTNSFHLASTDPCFGFLTDLDTLGNPILQPVNVSTRRDATFLYFFFEVQDFTDSSTTCGTLCSGDSIVLQFDADISRDQQLTGNLATPFADPFHSEYQIIIRHQWLPDTSAGALANEIKLVGSGKPTVFTRGGIHAGCSLPTWEPIPDNQIPVGSAPEVEVLKLTGPTRYVAEIRVPLALIGNPTTDIGMAMAVINDEGGFGSPPFGHGLGFPNDPAALPFTSTSSPVSDCGNWMVPNEWGTGFFGNAPAGQVSISDGPVWWNSDQVLVRECSNPGETYSWHATHPCKATIEARLQNTTGSVQTRNLLFLWAQFGDGDPGQYKVAALMKNVSIPTGLNAGPFITPVWSNMPVGSSAHPCLRVYILPTNLTVPGLQETDLDLDSIVLQQQAHDLVTAYGIGDAQWTQKNISGSSSPNCPQPACFAADMRKLVNPSGNVQSASLNGLSIGRFGAGDSNLSDEGTPLIISTTLADPAATLPAQKPPGEEIPVVKNPGHNLLLTVNQRELFSKNNVIVQVRTYGFGKEPLGPVGIKPVYRFVEELGGIIQMVPVDMLLQNGTVPFDFTVFNYDRELTIFHVVDVIIPGSASGAQVSLDTQRTTYSRNESRVVRGTVSLPRRDSGKFKHWGLSLHAGVSIPQGDFSNVFNPGPNLAVDLEYRFNQTFSLEGIYGYHRFNGDTFGPIRLSDLNLHQFSLNGKVYGSSSPVRPFVNFGGGAYVFTPGASVHGGLNIGGGLQFDVTPNFAVEGVYNFHNVFTSGSNTTFSGVQGGVRFRF